MSEVISVEEMGMHRVMT